MVRSSFLCKEKLLTLRSISGNPDKYRLSKLNNEHVEENRSLYFERQGIKDLVYIN
jgi:hypothetical protein